MALWNRLTSSKLRCLSHQCRIWYSPPQAIAGAPPLGRVLGRSLLLAPEVPSHFRIPMRSFAAPAQFKKPTAEPQNGPRLNEAITAPHIRLIMDEGHCILSREDALTRAKNLDLDLVEVQRNADPPVCKIMDFHKEKFKQSEKEKERTKSKSALTLRSAESKEVRFKAKTELKDLKMKAEMVIRLMERGYRVKCTAMPTGKEDENLGSLLTRLLTLIEDVSIVESGPHLDTRHAYVIVRHVKFAPKKSGKKISPVIGAVSKGVVSTPETISSTSQNEVFLDAEEEGKPIDSGADDDASYEQIENTRNETGWSGFSASDDFEDVFNSDSTRDIVKTVSTASMDSTAALAGKSPTIKAGLGPLKTKLEFRDESVKTTPGVTALKSGPSAVESNRYSKPSMQKGRFQPQPTRNERDLRGQLDPKQRQAHPNNPSSPAPKFGKFLLTKTLGYDDQSSLGGATTVKFNDRTQPSQSNGVYSGPRVGASGDRHKPGDATVSKPGDHSLPSQNYRIFNAATPPVGDQKKLGDATVGNSPTFGIFSSPRSTPPGGQTSVGNEATDKPKDDSSSTPRYGIFSAERSGASDNQRNSGNGTSSQSGKADPLPPSYGIFSASKSAASR